MVRGAHIRLFTVARDCKYFSTHSRRTIERIARLEYDSASTEVEEVAPPQIEMIPRCGIFCGGVEDFVIPVLTEGDPVESIANAQRRSTEARGLSVITDPEGRVGIRGGRRI